MVAHKKEQPLKVLYKKTADLKPYVNNSRTHSDEQIDQIAASINEFGFTNPLLIDDEGIIAGHGRLLAAIKLEMIKVPTIKLVGLSKAQRKAYVIADNQLALNAGWDEDLLRSELMELTDMDFDLDLIGFDDDDLSTLLIDPSNFEPSDIKDQGELDKLDEKFVKCPECEHVFDLRENE